VSTRCACGLLVVPTAMLLSAPAFAASTYIELLKERLPARVAERNDPRVLDELEVEYLGCLMDAFVAANIPPGDLAKLDQAVAAATIETDPLAGHYKRLANDPHALALMAEEAQRLCPDLLQAYTSATQ